MRRGTLRALLLVAAVGLPVAAPTVALGNSGGIPGYSGKTASMTCGSCHSGGTQAPTVTITGPTALVAGVQGRYTVDIVSASPTAKVSGIDVASSASPPPAAVAANEQVLSGEVVQTQPQAFSTGTSSWQLTWTPSPAGSYTLFAGAVAANQDGTAGGDSAATGTLAVVVVAAPDMAVPRDLAPPPPDLTPPPDLFGVDQAGLDLLEPPAVDMAAPVDAVSSASADLAVRPAAVDMSGAKPPAGEARWGCGCRVADGHAAEGEEGAGASMLLGAALGGTLLVRRRRR